MSKHHRLVTDNGAAVSIGTELGSGGEGAVFELRGNPSQVVKLYHSALSSAKQAKIAHMAANVDRDFLKYAAWPLEAVYTASGGPIVGFVMPSAKGLTPLHELYSPAHRKQKMPHVKWDFLIAAARNTAALFEGSHVRGYVLGDVNENTGSVSSKAQVTLIDCDSMQIVAGGQRWLCEVGVAHFTPPELQGVSSFASQLRTPNHDNFGLALIIFQLLFGGRHPYSGVPEKPGIGETLEGNIKLLAFAYARDAQARGIKAPPRSIPLALVPEPIAAMFTAAFTEQGMHGKRPSAHEWRLVLDDLIRSLQGCTKSKAHVFSRHLKQCPWCTLEQHSVTYFVELATGYVQTASGFVLAKVWAEIEAIKLPTVAPPIPVVSSNQISPRPMPKISGVGAGVRTLIRLLVAVCALISLIVFPKSLWIVIPAAIWVFAKTNDKSDHELKAEISRRQQIANVARSEYQIIENALRSLEGQAQFDVRMAALRKLRNEYQQLGTFEKSELDKYQSQAHQRQLEKFLSQFFIDQASISGLGPAKRAALRSWGLETAADVEWSKVLAVKGFGQSLTSAVVAWRKGCESRFKFDPTQALTPSDLAAVKARTAQYRRQLEDGLGAGITDLQNIRQRALQRQKSHMENGKIAAHKLAQAEADLAAAGG